VKKNIGTADRIIRLVVAAFLAVLLITGAVKGVLAGILGVIAAVFVITAGVGFCGLYTLLGIGTKGKGRDGGTPRIDV
jgi:hypothetical protein